jgi:hypothetical protein
MIAGSLRRCGVLSDQPEFLLAFLACGVYAQALGPGSTRLSRSANPADRTASGSRCYRPAQAGRPPSPAACSPRPPPPSRPGPPRTLHQARGPADALHVDPEPQRARDQHRHRQGQTHPPAQFTGAGHLIRDPVSRGRHRCGKVRASLLPPPPSPWLPRSP